MSKFTDDFDEGQEGERTPKYWICYDCADKKQWKIPAGACNTVISGLCGHCDREDEVTLTPTCDFYGPNGKRAIWD